MRWREIIEDRRKLFEPLISLPPRPGASPSRASRLRASCQTRAADNRWPDLPQGRAIWSTVNLLVRNSDPPALEDRESSRQPWVAMAKESEADQRAPAGCAGRVEGY